MCAIDDAERFAVWIEDDRVAAERMLIDLLAALDAQGWRPISEYQAEGGAEVLGWNERWGVTVFRRYEDHWAVAAFNGQLISSSPVKFQPLPAPPNPQVKT